jgi:hypothetical protein
MSIPKALKHVSRVGLIVYNTQDMVLMLWSPRAK